MGERRPRTAKNLSRSTGTIRWNGGIQHFGGRMEVRGDPGVRADPTEATFLRESRGMSEVGGHVSCTTQNPVGLPCGWRERPERQMERDGAVEAERQSDGRCFPDASSVDLCEEVPAPGAHLLARSIWDPCRFHGQLDSGWKPGGWPAAYERVSCTTQRESCFYRKQGCGAKPGPFGRTGKSQAGRRQPCIP